MIGAGLIGHDTDAGLAFRHALTRQAIYTGLLGPERQILHRRAAEFLEQHQAHARDQSRLADLARHWSAARVPTKAMAYTRQAGELSLSVSAPRSAVEHLSSALTSATEVDDAPMADLSRLRAEAYDLLGDFEAARGDFEVSLDLVRTVGDRQAEWELLLRLALLWAARDFEQTRGYAEAALVEARLLGDDALAHTLNRLGNWHANAGDFDQAVRHHEQALDLFQQRGDRRGTAQTLELLGMTSNLADPASKRSLLRPGHPAARRPWRAPGARRRAGGAHASERLVLAHDAGPRPGSRPGSVTQWRDRAHARPRERMAPPGEAFASWELAAWLGPRGHYQRALDSARQALAIAEEIDHPTWQAGAHLALGAIELDLMAHETAIDHLQRTVALSSEGDQAIFREIGSGLLASALIGARQPKIAMDVLEDDRRNQHPDAVDGSSDALGRVCRARSEQPVITTEGWRSPADRISGRQGSDRDPASTGEAARRGAARARTSGRGG